MSYEEYFFEVWNYVNSNTVSDEYYDRNEDLFNEWTHNFWRMNDQNNDMPPHKARMIITSIVQSLKNIGLR